MSQLTRGFVGIVHRAANCCSVVTLFLSITRTHYCAVSCVLYFDVCVSYENPNGARFSPDLGSILQRQARGSLAGWRGGGARPLLPEACRSYALLILCTLFQLLLLTVPSIGWSHIKALFPNHLLSLFSVCLMFLLSCLFFSELLSFLLSPLPPRGLFPLGWEC